METIEKIYPRGHMTVIAGLNALSLIVGLALATGPFVKGSFPGSFDTTVHVAVGMLIATLAAFRLAIAYGSIWIDVVLAALGLITFLLPKFMHMQQWNASYTRGHMAGGAVVMGIALISAALTAATLKKMARAA